jgi:glutamyl-tRNA synthetase
MKSKIKTRFAPSPTGHLHIGGVRTALFNYLFAKKNNGTFVLRIDDTDKVRNVKETIRPMIEGLEWLGVSSDERPVYQSEKLQHYRDVAAGLIKMGLAYPDYPGTPPEQIGSRTPYRGANRNVPSDQAMSLWEDCGWCLRFKIEEEGKIIIDDLVKGPVEFNTANISDPVIIRSDGVATYNFATAIDDAEMKISHVIRAEEHLSNTPVQVMIQHALGHTPPFFAHIPYVCEPKSKKKLSKRDVVKFVTEESRNKLRQIGFADMEIIEREELNPVMLTYYITLGYKPDAVANYLAKLGWSYDAYTEIMDMKFLEENFSLDKVVDGPAQFDPEKMLWVAGEHTKKENLDTRAVHCGNYIIQAKYMEYPFDANEWEKVRKIVDICGERIKVYSDILPVGGWFFKRPRFDKDDFEKYLNDDAKALLDAYVQRIKNTKVTWTAAGIENSINEFVIERGMKSNSLIFAIRVATKGNNKGPSLCPCLEILGKEECINRIQSALETVM